jgi:uncharacterized membrane protein
MVTAKRYGTKSALSPNRVEALTDGVFAIVMTLLVLELSLPVVAEGSARVGLAQGLINMWPKFLSYFVTFLMLGFMWFMHHIQFSYIKRSDSLLVWANIVFLMFIALLPFSTSLLGEYMGEQLPILIYGGNFIACMIVRYILWSYVTGKYRLVDTDIPSHEVRAPKIFIPVGITFFAIAMGLSYLNTAAAICIFAASIIFFIVNTMLHYRISAAGQTTK